MNDTITDSLEKAKELDQLRKDQEEIIVEINKIHKKLSTSSFLKNRVSVFSTPSLLSVFLDEAIEFVFWIEEEVFGSTSILKMDYFYNCKKKGMILYFNVNFFLLILGCFYCHMGYGVSWFFLLSLDDKVSKSLFPNNSLVS